MKTYHQFSEDIEQRRIELRQRSRDQMQKFKEKSKSSADSQRRKKADADYLKKLKDEIKRELRDER